MLSYWEQNTFFKDIDVVIVGSGIVGLNAAITLKERAPHLKVVILERGTLPIGASTRNAGFACFGSMTELLDDLNHHSSDEVWKLVEKRWKGLQRLRARVGDTVLDYQEYGGYELFTVEEQNIYEECLSHLEDFNYHLKHICQRAEVFRSADNDISPLGFKNIPHLLHNQAEGQIDTGKMMYALLKIAQAQGVQIFNGITVQSIVQENTQVSIQVEEGWRISCQKVLVATNGFARQLLPDIALQPARNQVLITAPIPNLNIEGTFHYQQGYFYFRNIHNRILLGGGRHLNKVGETTTEFGTTEQIQSALKDLLKTVILPEQDIKIDRWWSGILGVGEQKQPIIKEVEPNVFVAVRLGGMGVAIGSLIGEEAAEMVLREL